ncbi:PstS family phosphate ABC transporter substrate-binding protein [Chryseobacterium sp.]|uniref:PstS family phosphate ABC transporter substrate-binding protein n=1 Tax=Chryseobacterium sp. TaxID=1871047 RepID=UPI0011CA5966|nr:PstS family phosphate ABC transporter substrate-binding protein [Chryseobacterium sp.]TXF79469.1 PstS family phosphate ABC transporter substrate-binding protein [Chryseobacterium sp.]
MKYVMPLLMIVLSACSSGHETVKIKGSDTEVNLSVLLAEQFHRTNSSLLVSVSGGGSGLGFASLLNGNTDIANSSRSIKKEEVNMFRHQNIEIDSFVFAQDAIAFVVSDQLGIDSISTATLSRILSSAYTDWSLVTNTTMPITIYGRQSNSGTHDYVKDILNIKFSPYAKQMNGNAQILEAIKADASGIGYVSAGYILNGNADGLKILTVYDGKERAISPLDTEAIASGEYFFQRPLFQYYRKSNYQKIKPFLDFEKSAAGAKIIRQSGYYPVMK